MSSYDRVMLALSITLVGLWVITVITLVYVFTLLDANIRSLIISDFQTKMQINSRINAIRTRRTGEPQSPAKPPMVEETDRHGAAPRTRRRVVGGDQDSPQYAAMQRGLPQNPHPDEEGVG
jgi:hypothetical protein